MAILPNANYPVLVALSLYSINVDVFVPVPNDTIAGCVHLDIWNKNAMS